MALPTSYMTGGYTKIPQYFDTLLTARAPEKFTNKFMADLGFTSSTDRLFANVLKSIGFLDDSGVPTEHYDIHIHLPATRDQAVYDALFASLAKHIPLK